MRGAAETVTKEVISWLGVTIQPGRFGSTAFVIDGKREVGHIHGDSVVDIPCKTKQCEEWIAAGRAERHRFAPGFGVSVFLRKEQDVKNALELLRESYELKTKKKQAPG